MADTTDSKSVARKGVRVQIPPRVLTDQHLHRDPCALGHEAWSQDLFGDEQAGALIARISVAVLLQDEHNGRITQTLGNPVYPDISVEELGAVAVTQVVEPDHR